MPSITGFLREYFDTKKPKPPPLTTTAAAGLLALYTVFYVAPFYLSSRTRPSRTLSRDAPSVIKARITSVTLTCIFCSISTFFILTSPHGNGQVVSTKEALHSMGWWPVGLAEAARCLLLTAILFAGPLYESLIVQSGWRDWIALRPVHELFQEWTTWRNIVAGPLTEEVLFRSAAVPLMLLAQTPVKTTIFLSPIIFGLAHFHHFYEFRVSNPGASVAQGLIRSCIQLTYTTAFGAYATFLLLRTGSLLAIFVVHAFCNCMGFPRFWGRLDSGDVGDEDSGGKPLPPPKKLHAMWSVVYYVLLILGAVGFWKYLGLLTKSAGELVPIDV
ncbi:CaaX protease [Microdochium trichocladiopsis]|uniref:intramembrane prenyl-peptidase Rce1 n=1 Tax=Microdochium trichocladiopsis TaxID=1682393 RepID=A0A9P8YH29_9PEZI|nr:CaaX protease [Microdochium trichocladiopsis]KAH7038010.1 CaaX protease [Microdochium trichocladiopsis]